MNRFSLAALGALLGLFLVLGGCGGGTDTPADSGGDGSDGNTGECLTDAECNDANPCTDDQCQDRVCRHVNNTDFCDDGQACSTDDRCQDGVCSGDSTLNCDDGNPCTSDSCSDTQGCIHTDNTAPCDDGNACTYGEICGGGACGGGEISTCEDGNVCTDDNCDPASGCVFTNNSAVCDDGQECSSNDHCSNGVCVGDSTTDCNDNNPCTEDSCDDALGCVHSYNTAACSDGDACTEPDVCTMGTCHGGQELDCNDSNPCTTDSCDTATGCVHVNNTDPCTDNNACTLGDLCQGGSCVPGAAADCDDGNVCTTDSCDTGLGCAHANNALACDDNDPCTTGDVCAVGDCAGVMLDGDGDGHTTPECGGDDCLDSNPNVHGGVQEGPGNTCTDTLDNDCDGAADALDNDCASCQTDPDCNDNNVCNGTQLCVGGQCQTQSGTVPNCNDGNACTDDSCNPTTGCVYTDDNSNTCSDNNPCTVGDACVSGTCIPGTGPDCNDNNQCTDDSCNPSTGQCTHTPRDGQSCNDNNACTNPDACSGTTCTGTTVTCNDNNQCTDDSCNQATGCVYTNDNSNSCSDSSSCTTDDHCQSGSCLGSVPDGDSDGYLSGMGDCPGDDCDDSNPEINPGHAEVCGNNLDDNCSDVIDEGCASCNTIDPAAELIIDNETIGGAYGLAQGDRVMNAFFVDASSYNIRAVKAGFYDFDCDNGSSNQGTFSVHVYAHDEATGLPGAELGSSAGATVSMAGASCAEQEIAWHTFNLTAPVGASHGQLVWVAVQLDSDEIGGATPDHFLPFVTPGILIPYFGGFVRIAADASFGQVDGNWHIRAQGCAEGPWLTFNAHSETPAAINAGSTATSSVTLHNKGVAASAPVSGTLSCEEPELVVTADTGSFGTIAAGANGTGSPVYGLQATSTARGMYPLVVEASDGPHTWLEGYAVYVQNSGCSTNNKTLQVDNDTPAYYLPLAASEQAGNYYIVDSTSFALRSVAGQFYNSNTSATRQSRFRAKVYTYRAGAPDKLLATTGWVNVSVAAQAVVEGTFNLTTPLTFRQGNVIFVMLEAESTSTELGLLADDGADPSWMAGLAYSGGAWGYFGPSFIVRPSGCQSTELRYASHTSSPTPIPRPGSATLTITIANDGAENATNVIAVLSSTDSDVTVTQGNGTYGTVNAGQTKAASGFAITVNASADQFQYVLPFVISDGVNTWNEVVPIQLTGGTLDLAIENFSTSVVGNDIQYHWEIVNNGNIDCLATFNADLYINRDTPPPTGLAGDWTGPIAGLAAGGREVFDLVLTDAAAGTYRAYVQVDTNTAVTESNESNNTAGPSTSTIGDTSVFELTGWKIFSMPFSYRFVSGNTQPGMPSGQDRVAVQQGYAHWDAVASATISFTQGSDTSSSNDGYIYDGYNTVSFNDPNGEVPTDALAAALTYSGSQTQTFNGYVFHNVTDSDIVFNNNVSFCTHATAGSGGCWSSPCFDMEGVSTHEIGHTIGLDHPDVADATMYYAVNYCDDTRTSLEESDTCGARFVYGTPCN